MDFEQIKEKNFRTKKRNKKIKIFTLIIFIFVLTMFSFINYISNTNENYIFVTLKCGSSEIVIVETKESIPIYTFLQESECYVDSDDFVEYNNEIIDSNMYYALTDNDSITVYNVEHREVVENKVINFSKETKEDNTKYTTYKEVTQKGVDGHVKIEYNEIYINEEFVKKDLVNEVRIDPINEITVVGSKIKQVSNNSNSNNTNRNSQVNNNATNENTKSNANNVTDSNSSNNDEVNKEDYKCTITINGQEYDC